MLNNSGWIIENNFNIYLNKVTKIGDYVVTIYDHLSFCYLLHSLFYLNYTYYICVIIFFFAYITSTCTVIIVIYKMVFKKIKK